MDRTMTAPNEQREARGVSPAALIRGGGLLAIAAGASTILAPFIHPESSQSGAWVPVHLLHFATLMAILLVLVAVFVRQFRQAGMLGVAGFLVAFFGTAMGLMEGREHLFSPDFGEGTPLGLWQLILAGLVFSIGYIMLGVAIARARVLPRGAGFLLAIGGPVVAFSPPIGIFMVFAVSQALFGIGLAWTGYALVAGTGRERPLGG